MNQDLFLLFKRGLFKTLLFCLTLCGFGSAAQANNIQVSNVSLTGRDVSAGTNNASNFIMVKFDLSWENSWRLSTGPANWDAAWVFVKYRLPGGNWNHVWLNNTGHTAASGSTVDVGLLNTGSSFNASSNPGLGAFIYRNASGRGNVNFSNIQFRWNYGAQGLVDVSAVDVEVFAVEMVYVPQGSFYVGDGSTADIHGNFRDAATNVPFQISSEAAITLGGTTAGNLGNNNTTGMEPTGLDDFNDTTTKSLPAAFPKGFNAFYCMKYELSQRQWVEFFNNLTDAQKSVRDIAATAAQRFRNNISWTSGDAILIGGTNGDVACNYLAVQDLMAYMDWSGLRPMSEMEFEKAGRGTQYPVVDGFPWGMYNSGNPITVAAITNSGASNEAPTTAHAVVVGNNAYNIGPIRVGALATSSTSASNTGASWYGIQDLAGNVSEVVVSTGVSVGRNLTRDVHGDGVLASAGSADISTWPGYNSTFGINTGNTGTGIKGGAFAFTFTSVAGGNRFRLSNRFNSSTGQAGRSNTRGVRGVRSAP